jgi:hypothetical protein
VSLNICISLVGQIWKVCISTDELDEWKVKPVSMSQLREDVKAMQI